MALPQTQTSTPPSPDQLPSPTEPKQPTIEVPSPLQVDDRESASSTTPVVGEQTADDDQLPSPTEPEQPTIEVPSPLQVDDRQSASLTTPVVGEQTGDDDQLQQKKNNRQLDWPTLTIGFCLAAAAEMAVQARKTDAVSFHLLCMLLVLAFSAIFIASISSMHAVVARVLEHVGGFLGIKAFFLAITIAFPLWLKVVSWAIYALALLVIFICNYRQLAPLSPSPAYCCC